MIQETSQPIFTGGYHNQAVSVETREFMLDNQMHQFVHIHKKLRWLCRMAGGPFPLKSAGEILDDIREQYAAGASEVSDADAEPTVAGADLDPIVRCARSGDTQSEHT